MQYKYNIYKNQNFNSQSNFNILINAHDTLISVMRNALDAIESNDGAGRLKYIEQAGKISSTISDCFTQLIEEQKGDFESIVNFYLALYLKIFQIKGLSIEADKKLGQEIIEGVRIMKTMWLNANQTSPLQE